MLSGITITCFAASYTITLLLEISRLFFRVSVRMAVMVGFMLAGLFTHTVHLYYQATRVTSGGVPLSDWYDWCLLAAWVLAAVYLSLLLRRPQASSGLFILPLILILIAIAYVARGLEPFPRSEAIDRWGMLHGISLLLGTIVVMLGFAAGVMYLIQSYRLKHKMPSRQGLKLPSLELLQSINEQALLYSSGLLALGVISGIIINWVKHQNEGDYLPWTDPVVWSSGILFLWVVIASIFEFFYKPARQGRKVAYLTVASFSFLCLVLAVVLFGPSQHASDRDASLPEPSSQAVSSRAYLAASRQTMASLSFSLGDEGGEQP